MPSCGDAAPTLARQFSLQTEGLGFTLSQNLAAFPLLVRLTANEADLFAAAQSDGRDVRVTQANGAPVPMQIESWDAAAKQAALWVLVDTVFAAKAQTVFHLSYGNTDAADPTAAGAGAGVFAPAAGFAGVYHLDAKFADATAQAQAATDSGSTDVTGAIGRARNFNTANAYATKGAFIDLGAPASLDLSGTITLEAWVRWNSKKDHRVIVCHGAAGGSNTTETVLRVGEYQDYRTGVWNGKVHHAHANAAAGDSAVWLHLAGTYDGTAWTLYRNGEKAADTADAVGAQKSPGKWRIGAQSTGTQTTRYFQGDIDEVRISRVSRPLDYFRLGYATQKSGNTAVTLVAPTPLLRNPERRTRGPGSGLTRDMHWVGPLFLRPVGQPSGVRPKANLTDAVTALGRPVRSSH